MYEWKIKVIMNSGKELEGYYKGIETESGKVAEKLLTIKVNGRNFSGIINKNKTENILFCVEDVSAIIISVA